MNSIQIKVAGQVPVPDTQVIAEVFNTDLEQVKEVVFSAREEIKLELKPGRYLLRARLPSGETLRRQIDLRSKTPPKEVILWWTQSSSDQDSPQPASGMSSSQAPLSSELIASTWFCLWSWKDNRWQSEKWSHPAPAGDDNNIVSNLELPVNQVWLLQIGGDLVPHRFVVIPPVSQVEVRLRGTTRNNLWNGGIALDLITRESEIRALMQFMASGAAESAAAVGRKIATHSEKYAGNSPDGVALWCYYLLSKRDLAQLRHWPGDFMRRNTWLPDAAVIDAMQLLMTPEHASRPEIKDMLVRAAASAVPAYTRGFRYLLDEINAYNAAADAPQKDDATDEAFARIHAYASAVDWTESRTSFFGRTPDQPSSSLKFGECHSLDAVYLHAPAPAMLVPRAQMPVGRSLPESTLVEQSGKHVESARQQLHELCKSEILGYLRVRCGQEDAEEIAQMAWAEVLERIDTFNPDRGNFSAFVRYWAGIVALRWFHEKKIRSGRLLLFSELQSNFFDFPEDENRPHLEEQIETERPDAERVLVTQQSFIALFEATFFNTASPPHQLLAFGFCRLLDWRPKDFVAEQSDRSLKQLADEFERLYVFQLPAQTSRIKTACASLRKTLTLPLSGATNDRATLAAYRELSSRPTAETKFSDYYRENPEQNISHWIYAVRRRVLSALRVKNA
jgi:DNA-directed RNA polymerase specialized sigma24 family protein